LSDEEISRRAAAIVADGKILGWFQGRAEWGPRALGNRSIVADPRRPEMKEVLNRRSSTGKSSAHLRLPSSRKPPRSILKNRTLRHS